MAIQNKVKKGFDSVNTPSSDYHDMFLKWKLPEALKDGVDALRNEKYLPREPKETVDAYNLRKNRSFLFNVYWRVITSITGLAFVKPVSVSNVPKELEYLELNFDGNKRSLTEFAYDLTIDAIHFGLAHSLMDMPDYGDEIQNLKQFRESGIKPYAVQVSPLNLIGAIMAKDSSGNYLKNIRIREYDIEEGDYEWEEDIVEYVKLIRPNSVDVYRNSGEGFTLDRSFDNNLGYIPIATAYSNKVGELKGYPALSDLAQTNLCHFQSSSDQRNILHIARVPILLAAGFTPEEIEGMEIGANRMISSTNNAAKISHVEHTGKAMEAGQKDIDQLENQMATLGADLLMSKGVSRQTATARRLDQSESMSTLQIALRSVENAIESLYEIAGDYLDIDASMVSVSIGDDLSVVNEPNPTNALIALKETGLLTSEQVVEQAKRQGILSSDFKLDEERPELTGKSVESPLSNTGTEASEEDREDQDEAENNDNKEV